MLDGTKKYYVYLVVAHIPDPVVLYVGKGTGGRAKRHLNYARLGYRSPLWQAIRDHWFLGHRVTVNYILTTHVEAEALAMEKYWVDYFGRSTLLNATLGSSDGAQVVRGRTRRPIKPKE